MCGISGYINIKRKVDLDILERMTDIIDYRGPDDEGYALLGKEEVIFARGKDTVNEIEEKNINEIDEDNYFMGLGHRRLSILDLSVFGHQPMQKHEKVLVFNGEIYNYVELREELQLQGYDFVSNCDSEVILSAFDCWGESCVQKFNGMWAFAIYDIKKQKLFLSRDRFGVKPLYYYSDGEKMLFSSEIKQILCDESVPRVVNEEVLVHHLRYNFREYSEETFFKEIYNLRGGCNMVVSFDFDHSKIEAMKITRYYDLNKRIKVEECVNSAQLVGDKLRHAIKIRMRSDVKVGSCLSGGLDSSSIVGIIGDEIKKGQGSKEKFTTVTIGFPDEDKINEVDFSHQVTEFCNCEENVITPQIDMVMEHLESIVWHQDEPLPHLGSEVSYAVFKGAADNKCKVFFDGQGGDEGLAGYYAYYANYLWNVFWKYGISKFVKELKLVVQSSSMTYKTAIVFMLYFNIPFIRKFGTGIRRNKYLSTKLKRKINNNSIRTFFETKDGLGRQLEDYLYGSLPCILHWEDRNSMASSVETRLPFLDYEYVESVLSIKLSDKMKNGYTKVPLREYMDGLLPDSVIWRKNKLGFPAPTEKWLWEMPQNYVLELLTKPYSAKYFNIKKIRKEYLGKRGNAEMLEKFILVELWMRKFNIKSE